jgi:hypothetical protein
MSSLVQNTNSVKTIPVEATNNNNRYVRTHTDIGHTARIARQARFSPLFIRPSKKRRSMSIGSIGNVGDVGSAKRSRSLSIGSKQIMSPLSLNDFSPRSIKQISPEEANYIAHQNTIARADCLKDPDEILSDLLAKSKLRLANNLRLVKNYSKTKALQRAKTIVATSTVAEVMNILEGS